MTQIQGKWADAYRKKWTWDKVTWGSHSVDCYPGGCPWRVYTKDGKIVREEQAGIFTPIEAGIPDMNPMGCQKGACWSHCHYSPDRVTQPLKRVGERGEGKFKPVSWDEALDRHRRRDARRDSGARLRVDHHTDDARSRGRLRRGSCDSARHANDRRQRGVPGLQPRLPHHLGVCSTRSSSMDDWFLAELTLIWHANPVYTNIHWYHYVAESRYNGGEVVTIAPDYSPSAIHADYHLPVRIGTDAALALAMCKVIIDAGLYKKQFVQEQTDLPLLVRNDTGRFLRGSDVADDERDDQFFWWDIIGGCSDAGTARHAGDRRCESRARGQLHRHAQGREHGGGRAGVRAAEAPP